MANNDLVNFDADALHELAGVLRGMKNDIAAANAELNATAKIASRVQKQAKGARQSMLQAKYQRQL